MESRLIKGNYRLYCYDGNGNIRKVGEYRTDRRKWQRHFFDNALDAKNRVEELMRETILYKKGTQFLIIEYFFNEKEYWDSRIVELINT